MDVEMTVSVLRQQMVDIRAAYYRSMPGVTYDDMACAARRYLRMRAILHGKSGRQATPTKRDVARLLRGA